MRVKVVLVSGFSAFDPAAAAARLRKIFEMMMIQILMNSHDDDDPATTEKTLQEYQTARNHNFEHSLCSELVVTGQGSKQEKWSVWSISMVVKCPVLQLLPKL